MANRTAQHILGTSANLLGFCLFIITSLRLANQMQNTLVDEITLFVTLFLTVSAVCSFISIRSSRLSLSKKLETLADYLFIISLVGIFGIIAFIIISFKTS